VAKPWALQQVGTHLWQASAAAGELQVAAPGEQGLELLQPGALEQLNPAPR
jgi:flagellar hook protein FlgE